MTENVSIKPKLLLLGRSQTESKLLCLKDSFKKLCQALSGKFNVALLFISFDSTVNKNISIKTNVEIDFIDLELIIKVSKNKLIASNRIRIAYMAGLKVLKDSHGIPDIIINYDGNFKKKLVLNKDYRYVQFYNIISNLRFLNKISTDLNFFFCTWKSLYKLVPNNINLPIPVFHWPIDSNKFNFDSTQIINNSQTIFIIVQCNFDKNFRNEIISVLQNLQSNSDNNYRIFVTDSIIKKSVSGLDSLLLTNDITMENLISSNKIIYFGNAYDSIPYVLMLCSLNKPILFLTDFVFDELNSLTTIINSNTEWLQNPEFVLTLINEHSEESIDNETFYSDFDPETIAFQMSYFLTKIKL